ncbi:6-phosphogluconolactonase [Aurantivibrio infirmus]
MTWDIVEFKSNNKLADSLAVKIAAQLKQAVENNGEATLALSGGSTPKALLLSLSMQELPWDKITVTLVDERWVDEPHPDSNAVLIKEFLIQNLAKKAKFLPLKTNSATPFQAEKEIDQLLKKLPFPLDVVVLGMGNDGHTASFFPAASNLKNALDLGNQMYCCAITPPSAPHDRMTLTLSYLSAANKIFLHIVGSEKWAVLQSAIKLGPIEELPIRAFLHGSKNVFIYYADELN